MRYGDFPEDFCDFSRARVVILPVPFDKTCSWIKGAARGPEAILEASRYLEWYDLETGIEVFREGIHTAEPLLADSSEDLVAKTYARVKALRSDSKFVVTLGGEHTVSLGPVFALADEFPEMSVLQLDAHSDNREQYEGSRYSHACVMTRIKERVRSVVAVGIRSLDVSEKNGLDPDKTFYAHELRSRPDWVAQAVSRLGNQVYVTIDLDVFDPSLVPSTGTPEPGGLGWYDVLALLRAVASSKKVVAFDVVELCPMGHKASEFLAAKLIHVFLSYISFHNAW